MIEVVGSGLERLVQLLRSGAVDVAVGLEDAFAEWSEFNLERFSELRAVLFVRKGHPILSKSPISPSDLVLYNCILPSDSRPFSNVLRGVFESEGVSWKRRLHVTDNLAIARRLVLTSDAFALTSEEVAASAGFGESFERVAGESLFPPCPMCCATRSRWELSPPVRAFVEVMKTVPLQGYNLGV